MKRYNFMEIETGQGTRNDMVECDCGQWVRYADAVEMQPPWQELKARLEALPKDFEGILFTEPEQIRRGALCNIKTEAKVQVVVCNDINKIALVSTKDKGES